jgi:NADPH-dependent ferric siderophore reductase
LAAREPRGGYAPHPTADRHLSVGDEFALPGITAVLAALPAEAVARVLVEGPKHEPALALSAGADLQFVHRGTTTLTQVVQALEWLPGRVHAFVNGEAAEVMRGLRPWLFEERGLAREQVSTPATGAAAAPSRTSAPGSASWPLPKSA